MKSVQGNGDGIVKTGHATFDSVLLAKQFSLCGTHYLDVRLSLELRLGELSIIFRSFSNVLELLDMR